MTKECVAACKVLKDSLHRERGRDGQRTSPKIVRNIHCIAAFGSNHWTRVCCASWR